MPRLNILDISTTIGCNLSCKGCNHFSNYFAPSSKLDTDALLEDIGIILPRLDIGRVSVIGGEPLLNPRCKEIVNACRSHTNSPVYLYTNGLLLLQNEEWIKEVLEDERVFLRISIHLKEVEDIVKKFNHPKVLLTAHHTGKDRWFNSIKNVMVKYIHTIKIKLLRVSMHVHALIHNYIMVSCGSVQTPHSYRSYCLLRSRVMTTSGKNILWMDCL